MLWGINQQVPQEQHPLEAVDFCHITLTKVGLLDDPEPFVKVQQLPTTNMDLKWAVLQHYGPWSKNLNER